YLNEVYLGQDGNHAIHGFGLAARFYFSRSLEDLTLSELALLVGLVRGASHYNPRRHPDRARDRRNLVIDLMAQQGLISETQAKAAKRATIGVTQKAIRGGYRYPAFFDLARRQLQRDYREDDLRTEGLRIFTTLDPIIQTKADRALRDRIPRLEKRYGIDRGSLQGALVVTDSGNGEVLAMVGGRTPETAGFNRALDAVRPIGSLVKPAVYLTALEAGVGYTLTSLLDDQPVRFEGEDGDIWSPRNYDRRSHGWIPLHTALSHSYNQATVRLGMDLGLRKVAHTLRRLGIEREVRVYPSMLLGTVALPPIEVARLYQTLAGGGFRGYLRSIREVTGPEHNPLARYRLSIDQVVAPEPVYLVNTALQEAFREGTGRNAYARLPGHPALVGKTGTTDELRDSWFAGFGGERLAVVWLGRDDNRPARLTGAQGALQVWSDLMQAVNEPPWLPPVPERVGWFWIDETSRQRTDPDCPGAVHFPFLIGTEPEYQPCS
ncbi:MAG: penicillin-binding protein 1B, partial [Gammaproteobacteria bacterium]|nr:penicillin-binding protein 1B [Gammaproteobacteria bacterium]